MLVMTWKELINHFWDNKLIKTEWLALETNLARILTDDELTSEQKIALSKELIDAITRRGHFNPEEYRNI